MYKIINSFGFFHVEVTGRKRNRIVSCWSYGTEEESNRNGGRSIWNFFCFLFLISSIYAPKSLFLWKLIILKFEISSKCNFEIKKRECLLLCKYEHFGSRLLYLRTNFCLSCPIGQYELISKLSVHVSE